MSGHHPDMKSRVAANIAQAIAESELTVAEVARRMPGKVNEKTIRRWRDGESQPGHDNFAALASVLGKTDLTWFYLPHDEKPVAA